MVFVVFGDVEDIIIGDIDKKVTKVNPPAVDDASPSSSLPVHPLAKFLDLEDVVVGDTEDMEKETTVKSMRRVSKYIVCAILLSAPLLTILWATVNRRDDRMTFPIIVADDDATWAEATYQLQAEGFSKPRLQYDGNNGIPEAVFPLGLCRGDCDTDKECGVSILLL